MRRTFPLLALLVIACVDTPPTQPSAVPRLNAATDANDQPHVFNTQLRPENEVPPRISDGKGPAQIKLADVTAATSTVEFHIVVHNPENATYIAGHIHRAPEGVNGPIVIDLLGGLTPRSDDHIIFEGTRVTSAALAEDIRDNPQNYYINLHTTRYPGGEIRGQLR